MFVSSPCVLLFPRFLIHMHTIPRVSFPSHVVLCLLVSRLFLTPTLQKCRVGTDYPWPKNVPETEASQGWSFENYNTNMFSMLWTPPAYPGYSSCLGSLTKVEPSGIITFVPYGDEDDPSPPYKPELIGSSSLPISKSSGFPYRTPPLCSPEDDSEFQVNPPY